MELSIILVSYNTKDLTRQCLASIVKSLRGTGIRYEIIVVDNNSTDDTQVIVRDEFPKVVCIANQKNIGFGTANNQAVQIANGEYILLLNTDIIVINDAIEKILAFAKQHPNAFVGGKLVNQDRSAQSSSGPFFSLPVVFAALFLKGDVWGLTRSSPNASRHVDWVSGACIIAPKKLFVQFPFDEKIFMYMEEIDLLYRARIAGYPSFFYPRAIFVHLGAASASDRRKAPIINIYRGLLYFYKKHYSPRALRVLKLLLKIKAAVGWSFGSVFGWETMKDTYEEAYKLV